MSQFSKDALERAAKTFLGTFVTIFAGAFIVPADVYNGSDWTAAATAAAAAAITAAVSGLLSFFSKSKGPNDGSASLVV